MELKVYSVTPEFDDGSGRDDFRERLVATAVSSEAIGCAGILVPHNLHDLDPWVVAAAIGSATRELVPLVAVQPACVPPHTAAAIAAAFAVLHGRPIHFNLVAGAREDEMRQIGETLDHDERYARLREYAAVLRALLAGEEFTLGGRFYSYQHYGLEPCPEVARRGKLFIAGSSAASVKAAIEHADVVVTHPAPADKWREEHLGPLLTAGFKGELGIRIGIVCRDSSKQAWELARARFPDTWLGRQETLLKTRSTNAWSRRLAELAIAEAEGEEAGVGEQDRTYWLGAFRNGRASAPFLVGSYEQVAVSLQEYFDAGVRHVILNGLHDDDYDHTRIAMSLVALKSVGSERREGGT